MQIKHKPIIKITTPVCICQECTQIFIPTYISIIPIIVTINDKIIREDDYKFLDNIELLKDGNIKYLNYTIKVANDSLGILVKESDLIRLKVLD